MKVLITGAGGQVGKEIMQLTKPFNIQVIGLRHAELDVTDTESISNALNTHVPDVLVNTAAYTDVEKAETKIQLAYDVNRWGAAKIAEICFNLNFRAFLHYNNAGSHPQYNIYLIN